MEMERGKDGTHPVLDCYADEAIVVCADDLSKILLAIASTIAAAVW
jgi:hypothetical protein